MSEQPTPGPWWDEDGVVYGNSRTDVVAEVAEIFGYPDEKEAANARLIAAAPELLEAVKMAEETIGWITDASKERYVMETLRKAIAKAEGRE